ncbi:MAG: GIY-YIG nuclease family protein [Archaeoglobaceae archaeon]|nr:GIY-YIG nuclease family protein [Archaeoglobaceae archaeon]MDW8117634.1 GIY-YIG nuclease family protein [Archaeoglobaceae archaeon]
MSSYVLILRNDEEKKIEIGKLGKIYFRPGVYYYVGSAKKISRVIRHFNEKRKRWHIDYISGVFEILGAILFKISECELASKIEFEKVKRFGCSDCSCESHLFYSKNLTIENLFT